MKNRIAFAMIAVLLFSFCGCSSAVVQEEGFADTYVEGDSAGESVPAPEKEEPSAPSQSEKKPSASAPSEKEPAKETPQTSTKPNTPSIPNTPNKPQSVTPQQTPTQPSAPTPNKPVQDDRLPAAYPVFSNGGGYYYGIAKGENGTIAAIGKTYFPDEFSFIEIYDANMSIINTRTFKDFHSISKVISCSDGGFLIKTDDPSAILKLDRNLKTEWGAFYPNILTVQEIWQGNFAILTFTEETGRLDIQVLDQTGKKQHGIQLATVDISVILDDFAFFGDGNGGFYLVGTWEPKYQTSLSKITQAYNPADGSECLIAHFSENGSLTQAVMVGSSYDEWCEEIAMDESGYFYIALATTERNNPLFSSVFSYGPKIYRRVLAKVDRNGSIKYIAPLSAKATATDQVFGIEFSGDNVFVAGFSAYNDTLQNAFPCAHNESGSYEYVNYIACINGEGKVYDRRLVGGDVNNQPAGSVLLPNGTLVVCGSVSRESPFNISFPTSCNVARTLFVYPGLAS